MKKGQELEVFIEKTEFGGYGVGYRNDKKVYVKGTIPGQKVKIRVSKKKKDYLEGKVCEMLEKAPYEIDAPCPHFGPCGGCSTQFISYDQQLKLKTVEVMELFSNAMVTMGDFLGIEGSPEVFEYRNKMEFSFGDMERGGELQLGMHRKGSPFSIVSVGSCMLVDEDFRKIFNLTLEYFRETKLPHYRVMAHEGYLRHFIIRKGKNTGEISVNLVTSTQVDFDLTEWLEKVKSLELQGTLTSVIHTSNDSLSDAVVPEKVDVLYGRDYIMENILGLDFKISPFSFFQTNSKGAETLYSIVKEFMGDSAKNKVVFDLYCGTGTIGQIVAGDASKVKGIEIIEEAVVAANENAKLNGLDNCEFIAGDVAKVITELKDKPDIIILDPPRSGVHPKALEYVVKFNAEDLIYVSCNPKTLVNDLKYLTEHGYTVQKTKLKDMFPNTPHVETVVKLQRKHS
ncbi:23S rRNA (uracil(1939)-C(5))-methyltransferase RlmD [Clostridium frigidicarnis]|uniref:23S rRNA (Uracil-5-)-methyltransferase RumA n=1 Tax=Clostridium frigidicarnis TaxID=84698 RepID=A0A1I0YV03_9CLOT|nr:23S rRNA (uracil(1939)-C(5))-methyltransferase RlmD [Clostridium frigidicarnis]SFB16827.1 23S rRNA (uracil-5-)-methyltransferase RumA [Clostridium frigidicarnis]